MDDIMGKIGELLSDEESVKQLSEIAQMLMSDSASPEEKSDAGSGSEGQEQGSGGFDIGSIMKLTGLLGSVSQSDKNTELLLALRPHLREEKQKRVDKAVKLLRVIAVWNLAKESGLLNDLI